MKYKGKSYEFLLETIYDLDSRLHLLENESNAFYEKPLILQIYHLILCYIQQKIFKTKFNTMITVDLAESLTMINKFEKGAIPAQTYKNYVSKFIKTKPSSCRTCGGGANAKQIHDNFQKTIFTQLKQYNPMVFGQIEFVSAKYRNLNGKGTIEFYNYANLYMFTKSLTEALKRLKAKKLFNEAELVMQDLQAVKNFINIRTDFDVLDLLNEEGVEVIGDEIIQTIEIPNDLNEESKDFSEESLDILSESNDVAAALSETEESNDFIEKSDDVLEVEQTQKKERKPRKKKD